MQLYKLGPTNLPDQLVENYDSLIWTERYNTCGDFELVTGDVSRFMNLLPAETFLTLADSNVGMIVETHIIERKKNQPDKLTIKGRSFDSILERRAVLDYNTGLAPNPNYKFMSDNPTYTACYLITKHTNTITNLPYKDKFDTPPVSLLGFVFNGLNVAGTGPQNEVDVPNGNLLSAVQNLLVTEYPSNPTTSPPTPVHMPTGMRGLRPGPVSLGGSGFGFWALEIYKGVDHTETITFDASRDALDDGTYIFSTVGSANVAYGVGDNVSSVMYEGSTQPLGMDRRVILVDASDSGISEVESLRFNMSIALSEARPTAIFDGSINQDRVPYKFKVDYNLGDLVTLKGDYGLDEIARVTEYIRTEDATGEKAYPTLTTARVLQ